MKGKYECFLKYQRYNKKKKPWRNLKWADCKNYRKGRLKKWLCLSACLEAAILLLHYGDSVADRTQDLVSISQEAEAAEEPAWGSGSSRKKGETREQGISVDWKAGTVKLWRKVERIVLPEQD